MPTSPERNIVSPPVEAMESGDGQAGRIFSATNFIASIVAGSSYPEAVLSSVMTSPP